MGKTIKSLTIAACLAGLGFAGCAGTKERQSSAIGKTEVREGSTQVVTEVDVTETVEEQTQIPTLERVEVYANLNEIDKAGLMSLGVPADVADSILNYRDENDGFLSVTQLQEVPGMTAQLYDQLLSQVAVARRERG